MERVGLISVLDGVSNCMSKRRMFWKLEYLSADNAYTLLLSLDIVPVWNPILPFDICL